MTDWASKIRQGDARALARAATAVENRDAGVAATLAELAPFAGHARVVGITGPPGAGKSTLVDALASALRQRGQTVAVVAVDPSSHISGGALLGDRIRMQRHHADPGIFIRSVATRGAWGGLARATAGLVRLMDGAGKDWVLIETVGVGQDEVEIASLAQVTIVALVPGMGDDVQASKAGLMEIADIFVINKADLPGAGRLEREIHAEWPRTPIVKTVATEEKGIDQLLEAINNRPLNNPQAGASSRSRDSNGAGLSIDNSPLPDGRGSESGTSSQSRDSNGAGVSIDNSPLPDGRGSESGTSSQSRDSNGAGVSIDNSPLPDGRGSERGAGVSIDHIGIAVPALEPAIAFYESLGFKTTHRQTVSQEKVHVAMLPAGNSHLELLEPSESNSPIAKFLEKRGPGLHHVALRVPDLDAAVARLLSQGARLLDEPRPGAGGHRYVFVHPASTGGVLLELIQES